MRNNSYPKRDPIKDYFLLPNEIFYLGLSYGEIAVYSYLLYRENRKTFQCYPSSRQQHLLISGKKHREQDIRIKRSLKPHTLLA